MAGISRYGKFRGPGHFTGVRAARLGGPLVSQTVTRCQLCNKRTDGKEFCSPSHRITAKNRRAKGLPVDGVWPAPDSYRNNGRKKTIMVDSPKEEA